MLWLITSWKIRQCHHVIVVKRAGNSQTRFAELVYCEPSIFGRCSIPAAVGLVFVRVLICQSGKFNPTFWNLCTVGRRKKMYFSPSFFVIWIRLAKDPNKFSVIFSSGAGRGGGLLIKVLYWEAPPRGPTPYSFINHFRHKRYPFVYLISDNRLLTNSIPFRTLHLL